MPTNTLGVLSLRLFTEEPVNIKLAWILVLGALATSATSARATTIRTGSNYGDESASCTANNQMQPATDGENSCIQAVSLSPITIGAVQDPVQQFTFYNSTTDQGVFDLINLGTVTSSSGQFVVSLADMGLLTGVFACNVAGNSTPSDTPTIDTTLTDGGNTVNNVACTQDVLTPYVTGTPSASSGPGTMTFTVDPAAFLDSSVTDFDLVVFTIDGNLAPVTTPEPDSLPLVALGLIPVAVLYRRRLRA
jgi:hypothetical protein